MLVAVKYGTLNMNLIDRVKNVIEKILPKKKPEIAQDATSEPISLSSSPSISLADDSISPLVPQASSTAVPIIIIECQNKLFDSIPSESSNTETNAVATGSCTSSSVILTDRQKRILEHVCRSSSSEQRFIERSRIILARASGKEINQISRELDVDRKTVRKWCYRWNGATTLLQEVEHGGAKLSDNAYCKIISEVLNDEYRMGAPGTFTPEQVTLLYAIACEVLDDSSEGVSHWTHKDLADEMVKRGIVESISPSSVGRLLQEADLKPHRTRYWMTSPEQGTESFKKSSQAVCDIYKNAATLHSQGIHVISTDEKTGIQALERLNPTYAMEPKIQSSEHCEHGYDQHVTLKLAENIEVSTGQMVNPTMGESRIGTDENTGIQVIEQLNSTHVVESKPQNCERRENSYEQHGTLTLTVNDEKTGIQVIKHLNPTHAVESKPQSCERRDATGLVVNQTIAEDRISTDEKTDIQVIKQLNPTHAAESKPQSSERREHSYERHGTLTLTANFEVATGQVVNPTIGETRTEKDFLEHVERTVDTDPNGTWIIIVDQLNTHQSASLVEMVADRCDIKEDLGEKGKEGILESMESRKKFLEDPNHRIRFVYTPKHASWLNQVEIWFSILSRRLLRRGNFLSLEQLRARILSFIEFFNKTMAKPFKWIYTGRPLAA